MKNILFFFLYAIIFLTSISYSQTLVTIGSGSSTSANTDASKPIYSSGSTSSYIYSKTVHLILASELASQGVYNGAIITKWGFNKADGNRPNTTSSWTLRVYLKNSTATSLSSGTSWNAMISGATLVYENTNINNSNMPSTAGFWLWTLQNSFTYTGGSIECYVEWEANNSSCRTTGAINWKYDAVTANQSMGDNSTSSIPGTWSTYYPAARRYQVQFEYYYPNCNGIPSPGNTVANPAIPCINQTFTLSLPDQIPYGNLTYQWQISNDAINWDDIVGANGMTLNYSLAQSAYFRCKVTCPGFGYDYSNPIFITPENQIGCYCKISARDNNQVDGITRVVFNTINNSSTGNPAYTNFTHISTNVYRGSSYALSVYVNTNGNYTYYVTAWIDWNQNLIFDPGEMYQLGTVANQANGLSSLCPFNITVPPGAALGKTFMRIAAKWASYLTDPCTFDPGGFSFQGEAEDYTIYVLDNPCSGTPNPGQTMSTATVVHIGEYFTLSLQNALTQTGLTFQWQSSPDNLNWTNIPGATAPTYETYILQNTYFRCLVTCINSGLSAYSTPVQITTLSAVELGSPIKTTCVGPTPAEELISTAIKNRKNQLLFRASDLYALGITTPQNITSMSVYVTQKPGTHLQNFNIKMRHITLSAFAPDTIIGGPFVTVYSRSTLSRDSLDPGWRKFKFDQPFYWNGSSNILVQFCISNSSTAFGGKVLTYPSGYRCYQGKSSDHISNLCDNYQGAVETSDLCRPLARFSLQNTVLPTHLRFFDVSCEDEGFIELKWFSDEEETSLESYVVEFRKMNGSLLQKFKVYPETSGMYHIKVPGTFKDEVCVVLSYTTINGQVFPLRDTCLNCKKDNIYITESITVTNPISDELIIHSRLKVPMEAEVMMREVNGKIVVWEKTILPAGGTKVLSLGESLAPGPYLLRITTSQQTMETLLIKQ
ncbi:MAG: GEVED domain-containing protein [Bacteroidales bacterium]|nr:GEVED domain-containing protein [Bacteroidales bacterium]